MKKLAIVLAFTFFLPVLGATFSHSAKATASDLAVGDPMGKGPAHTTHHHKHKTTTTAPSTDATKPAAEKPAAKAPAKAPEAEPAK